MIVYGWGKQTRRTLGVVASRKCTHCGSLSDFHLVNIRTWFTLFWIPVIPYNSKHLVLCGQCEWGWQPSEAELPEIKAAIASGVVSRPAPTEISAPSAFGFRVGDFVKPVPGSVLRAQAASSGNTVGPADLSGPAVVLAVGGVWVQVRDASGQIGWLPGLSLERMST